MAKKQKTVVNLSDKEITFSINQATAKVITFNPNTMTLQINLYEGEKPVKTDNHFPFAHLPKSLKKIVKPN